MIKFYMLTWPIKQILMKKLNVLTVEEAADVFDNNLSLYIELTNELPGQQLLMSKFNQIHQTIKEQ